MKFGVVCGVLLVGLAVYLAMRKRAAPTGDPAVTSDIIFTDEEAGTIEVSPSSPSARTPSDPLAAGVLGTDTHRSGASL